MPNYQINIPQNLLFHGFPGGVPQGTPNHLTIDLWNVQQQILYCLVNIAFMLFAVTLLLYSNFFYIFSDNNLMMDLINSHSSSKNKIVCVFEKNLCNNAKCKQILLV